MSKTRKFVHWPFMALLVLAPLPLGSNRPITGWEAALALPKPGGQPASGAGPAPTLVPSRTTAARNVAGAHRARDRLRGGARVPARYGPRDPGDCFIIASARLKRVPIVTRRAMIALAEREPACAKVVVC